MGIAGCHPYDLRYCSIPSRWHNVIWTLSHPDELAAGRISSGWLLDTAVCHPDDISYHLMSSGWLSRNWYLIRMSNNNVIMSSGWHRLPFLSHPDEIANFDFPHHAMALQCLCTEHMTPTRQALPPGRSSCITGQVVQQGAEVLRFGPLNRTVGCPCMQGFLTLAKLHV